MRLLLQPWVLNRAGIAALVSALACYPRLSLWQHRPAPLWYLETTIFICCLVLWSFVFAWHTAYTNRPVFVLKLEPGLFVTVTLIGISVAAAYHWWLDPPLRSKLPEEFPVDLKHWFALIPFSLALNQLFLLFAPFDWLMRLLKNRWVATGLTALFGAGVLAMKLHSLPTPVPPLLVAALLTGRIGIGLLAVEFYLHGGVLLVWWWTLLLETRHLLNLTGNS